MIRMQKSKIASGCLSRRVRRQALRERKLTQSELLAFGWSIKLSEEQATGIEKEINVAKLRIDAVKRQQMNAKFRHPRRPQHKQNTCFNCTGNYPHNRTNLAKPKDRDADRAIRLIILRN